MKILITLLTLIVNLYTCSQEALAQPKVGIYAIESGLDSSRNYNGYHYITCFDYIHQIYDTILTFKGKIELNTWQCTIDPYNGRYFLYGKVDSPYVSTDTLKRIITIDLCSKTILPMDFPYNNQLNGEMEYDMFGNRLLIRNAKNFFSHELATQQLTILDTLTIKNTEDIHATIANSQSAYNPIDNKYVFSLFDRSLFKVVLHSYDMEKHILSSDTIYPTLNQLTLHQLNYKYYAVMRDTLGELNLPSGSFTNKIQSPTLPFVQYNFQQCVIDANNDKFLHFQYYQKKLTLDIFDLTTNLVTSIDFPYRLSNYQEYYGAYPPQIKRLGDSTLIATYGSAYQWYFNKQKIDGATGQTVNADKWGWYSVEVTFCNDQRESQEFAHFPVSISTETKSEIQIYPNPVIDFATITLNTQNGVKTNFHLYDINGRTVKRYTDIQSTSFVINRNDIGSGIYFYTLFQDNYVIARGTLVFK